MKATVTIPLFQGSKYIRACLRTLQRQSEPSAVIVVNNGSQDDGPDIVRREFPDVTLLDFAQPLGFAGAVNAGIRTVLAVAKQPTWLLLLFHFW